MAANLCRFQKFENESEGSSIGGPRPKRYKSNRGYKMEQERLTGYWHDQRLYLSTLHELALE